MRITKTSLDRWRQLQADKKELERKARALDVEAKAIEASAKADLESSGKDHINRGGYRIAWVEGRASIAWKNEFVDKLGAEAAAEIAAKAPVKKSMLITPPAEG